MDETVNRVDPELLDELAHAPDPVKLNIGCGPNPLGGWINCDLEPFSGQVRKLDATQLFPFDEATFTHVFSEHMIEHVPVTGGEVMIRECFRVLRPGGRIRISTPDLEFLIALTRPPLSKLQNEYIAWSCRNFACDSEPSGVTVMNFFHRLWGHQHIYDRHGLWALMKVAGFVDPLMCRLNESPDRELQNLENENRMPAGYLALETMTLEAVKPGSPTGA